MMCACKHCTAKLSLYYWRHWSCWWISTSNNPDLTQLFIIKAGNVGRLKKQIMVKKTQWEPCWSHAEKRLLP